VIVKVTPLAGWREVGDFGVFGISVGDYL